jgi:hypothetical protein
LIFTSVFTVCFTFIFILSIVFSVFYILSHLTCNIFPASADVPLNIRQTKQKQYLIDLTFIIYVIIDDAGPALQQQQYVERGREPSVASTDGTYTPGRNTPNSEHSDRFRANNSTAVSEDVS